MIHKLKLPLVALIAIAPLLNLQASLVAHWKFDNNFDATVGTNGTGINGPSFTADQDGNPNGALSFDANSSQYVTISGGGGLSELQSGTIAMFVKWSGTQDAGYINYGHVLARQHDRVYSNQIIGLSTSSPDTAKITWSAYDPAVTDITGSTIVGDNQWHHVAVTWESGSHTLYLDGEVDGTSEVEGTIRSSTIPLTIGAWIGSGQSYSNSSIDDVRIYNNILSQSEVLALVPETRSFALIIGIAASFVVFCRRRL